MTPKEENAMKAALALLLKERIRLEAHITACERLLHYVATAHPTLTLNGGNFKERIDQLIEEEILKVTIKAEDSSPGFAAWLAAP